MPVTNYYTVDGQMIGYKDAGGRKDFLTDALGSVTAEVDQSGATKTFDGRYKPYGGDLSSTGARGSYGWVGTWGYREANLAASSHYVRARHYSKLSGTWTSVDILWPDTSATSYAWLAPTDTIDPTGLAPCKSNCCEEKMEAAKQYRNQMGHCPGGDWFECSPNMTNVKQWYSGCKALLAGPRDMKLCQGAIDRINTRLAFCLDNGKSVPSVSAISDCCGTEVCVTWCCRSNINKLNPCFKKCLSEHEREHGKGCTAHPPGPPSPETCAYAAEAKCLFNTFKGYCGWTDTSAFKNWNACMKLAKKDGC